MRDKIKNFGSAIIKKTYSENIDYKIEYYTLIALLSSLCILHGISLDELLSTVKRIYNKTQKRIVN